MYENKNRGWETVPEEKLNPWLSIWLEPRYTMRYILDKSIRGPILLLAALGGIADALSRVSNRNTFDTLLGNLTSSVLGGIIGGIIGVYITAALISWTGRWIGGEGRYNDILTAVCWSNVPAAWSLVLWAIGISIFGNYLFLGALMQGSNILLRILFLIINMSLIIIKIWSVFTTIKCLAEAQRFSSWRALGNLILAALVLIVPLIVIITIGAVI